MGGEVHHRVDAVLVRSTSSTISRSPTLPDDERRVEHRLAEAAGQIVQHDDPLAAGAQLEDDVAADVAGAAGDQDGGRDSCSALMVRGFRLRG